MGCELQTPDQNWSTFKEKKKSLAIIIFQAQQLLRRTLRYWKWLRRIAPVPGRDRPWTPVSPHTPSTYKMLWICMLTSKSFCPPLSTLTRLFSLLPFFSSFDSSTVYTLPFDARQPLSSLYLLPSCFFSPSNWNGFPLPPVPFIFLHLCSDSFWAQTFI